MENDDNRRTMYVDEDGLVTRILPNSNRLKHPKTPLFCRLLIIIWAGIGLSALVIGLGYLSAR